MQENSLYSFTIEEDAKLRLDAFLAQNLQISRAQATKAILSSSCLVNSKEVKRNYILKYGDIVEYTAQAERNELIPEEGDLDILYQDNDYVIINKPPNLTVHPAPSQEEGTLVHILLKHFPQMQEMEGLRPGIVHRIDKDTSGIIVIALHDMARRALSELFELREVHKEYIALVHNTPPKEGLIDLPIGRHEKYKTKMAVTSESKGKHALTEYQVIHADKERNYALLAVKIHTGRTHQIRVHFSHAGYPLLGDKLYTAKINKPLPKAISNYATRQMLHASKICFTQPLTGKEIEITCPMPEDMKKCLEKLKSKLKRTILTGSVGSGKSSALKIYNSMGYSTFSADEYVKSLYEADGAGTFLLYRLFGDDILNAQNGIDKAKLFTLMQEEENKIKIEKILHPLVFRAMQDFFVECEEKGEDIAFAEIPLYFESTLFTQEEKKKYKVITFFTEDNIRKERLLKRNVNKEILAVLDSWQMPIEEKKKKADYTIDNSKDFEDLENKCKEIVEEILALASL